MRTVHRVLLLLSILTSNLDSHLGVVFAHKHPKTEHEKEVQRNLQAAAYHCAPAVESFTRSRKRAFAQRALSGLNPTYPTIPGFLDQQHLFAADAYAGLPDGPHPAHSTGISSSPSPDYVDQDQPADDQETYMQCMPISDTHIQNNTCVLAPEVTEGPYYHTEGHPIRQNIAEYEDGLLLMLDIGVIDVETCKPIPNVLVDIWQANATGSYAGHPVPHPHLINEQPATSGKRKGLRTGYPRTIHSETFLRGAWPTDRNGVAQFTSIYPGYYTGRATHIHTKVFTSWTTVPPTERITSSSISGTSPASYTTFTAPRLAHVGQFFFDEHLNAIVDKMYPYVTNPIKDTIGRTRNVQDSLNIFHDSHGPEGKYDPVFKVHLAGGVLSQGLVAFITMGVNKSAEYDNFWKG